MPRIARVVAVAVPHHVTQRGNNRQQVFFSDSQRRLYLALLADHADRHQLDILGYCLMPNHVHVVAVPRAQTSMALAFGRAHQAYSRYLNRVRNRSGHLWQNRFYSAPLGESHLIAALRYVDLNPVRAGLVERAERYRWSSAEAHVNGRDPAGLVDPELWREVRTRDDWGEMLGPLWGRDEEWERKLRSATYSGKPLGNQEFVATLERAYGGRLTIRGPGRPRNRRARSAVV